MTTSNGTETAGEHLIRKTSEQGFAPSPTRNANYIEFIKDYADGSGRIARATVQFERTRDGGVRIVGTNALVQAHIPATVEDITERAPPIMQEDLLALLHGFGEPEPGRASIDVRRCARCDTVVSEFFVIRGEVLCRECK